MGNPQQSTSIHSLYTSKITQKLLKGMLKKGKSLVDKNFFPFFVCKVGKSVILCQIMSISTKFF